MIMNIVFLADKNKLLVKLGHLVNNEMFRLTCSKKTSFHCFFCSVFDD